MLFGNSNKLYHLGLTFREWETDDNNETIEAEMEETDLEIFTRFLRSKHNQTPDFVRISWTDLTAVPRMRMVPFRKMITLLEEGHRTDIGITKAAMGVLQNDWLTPGFVASGEYRLHPDFSSLKAGPIPGHWSMYGEFREQDGSTVALCPRTQLQRAQEFGAREGLSFLMGFEIEFLLLVPVPGLDGSGIHYTPLPNDGHAWSVSRFYTDPGIPKLLADIVKTLEGMEIFVEQIHAESAPGQFEVVLPPLPPLAAVDTLLHTREVIAALATAAGYKFSLYPKPFAETCGTASHVHISISGQGQGENNKKKKGVKYEAFYAGLLKHLRAITAFTYSNPVSYERMMDGAWAGGRYVASPPPPFPFLYTCLKPLFLFLVPTLKLIFMKSIGGSPGVLKTAKPRSAKSKTATGNSNPSTASPTHTLPSQRCSLPESTVWSPKSPWSGTTARLTRPL